MEETLLEFVNSSGVSVRVDREQGVIRGVKLLGLDSSNGRKYLPEALRRAISLYEGAKVNVNHPKGNPLAARDYQDRLGSIRNVSVRASEGLFGDLHFNPKHALAEQLVWDASNSPENVGFSHNVQARTSRQGEQVVVEAIVKVQSVDLVADPATTRGLYESAASSKGAQLETNLQEALSRLTMHELRSARPDLIDAIVAESASKCGELQMELDRLQASEAVHKRRAAALRLLREYKLPDPELADASTRPLVSELFFEGLLAAPSEQDMRALVQERAQLLEAARRLDRESVMARPVSREQSRFELVDRPLDVEEFARAITS